MSDRSGGAGEAPGEAGGDAAAGADRSPRRRREAGGDGAGDADRSPRRRRWGRLVLLVALLWVAACAAVLFSGVDRARSGLRAARTAEGLTSPDDLVEGRALAPLRRASSDFATARARFDNPLVAPLKLLPVAGRQLRSTAALAATAAELADVGAGTVADARAALRAGNDTGPERVALVRRMARLAATAERRLAGVDLGPRRALVGPLADKRAELSERLEELRQAVSTGRTVAAGLADLLAGPRRYLVLAANNAEMRSGSGMFLSVGDLTFDRGDLSVGEMRPSPELKLTAAQAPPVDDADLAARWGWLTPNREWRNLAASPRFPPNARLAARMWSALGSPAVDGVITLDPVALRAVLSATGPVEVGGRSVSEENVVPLLLHDQYSTLTEEDIEDENAARREQLGLIALAAVGALQAGDWDVAKLATGLAKAARGRHVLAWAAADAEQRAWEAAGVDGDLDGASLLLSVLNLGGNKLDQFLEVDARLALQPGADGTAAELRVTLRNRTPEGQVHYVAGPHPRSPVGAGEYLGALSVNLPGEAEDVAVEGSPELLAAGPDGPTKVVAFTVRVDRGGEVAHVVRFRLPAPRGALRVEPSARVPPVRWTAPGSSWRSGEARVVRWG